VLLVLLVPVAGCSRSVGETTDIDVKRAAAKAMAEYDVNGDGHLDAKELERCPGLKSALPRFDRDCDGRLSRAEIEEGLAAIQQNQFGLTEVMCRFTLNRQPLAGANVVLEPESFLQPYIKPARGTTDEKGRVVLQIEGESNSGCNVGLYRVRVSKKEGRELVPARYNTQTELGLGVGSGLGPRGTDTYSFHLASP
jgi:hypothetical protein